MESCFGEVNIGLRCLRMTSRERICYLWKRIWALELLREVGTYVWEHWLLRECGNHRYRWNHLSKIHKMGRGRSVRIESRGTVACVDSKVREGIWGGAVREVGESPYWDTRNEMFLKERSCLLQQRISRVSPETRLLSLWCLGDGSFIGGVGTGVSVLWPREWAQGEDIDSVSIDFWEM